MTAVSVSASSSPRFVHLRLHTEYSITDGIVGIEQAVARAAADGMPALVAWQSGEWMLSVSTNGGLALARAAATDLPHEPVHGPDLLGRILAGWARITSVR